MYGKSALRAYIEYFGRGVLAEAGTKLVVFSLVTQRSSPQKDERCVTRLKTAERAAERETRAGPAFRVITNTLPCRARVRKGKLVDFS